MFSKLAIAFVLFLIYKGYRAMTKARKKRAPEAVVERLAELAVEDAQKVRGVALDYSEASIATVEEILGTIYGELAQKPEPDKIRTAGSMYGAYVGEVMRHANPGATWQKDHPTAGPNTWPLDWGGGQSFPLVWCMKRLQNGPEDNVAYKYTALKKQRELKDIVQPPPAATE